MWYNNMEANKSWKLESTPLKNVYSELEYYAFLLMITLQLQCYEIGMLGWRTEQNAIKWWRKQSASMFGEQVVLLCTAERWRS